MKQLNITLILVLLMSMVGLTASAHAIEVENAQGKTIYYNYINNNTELVVTYRGSSYNSYSNEYTGEVIIPEEVTYNNKTLKVTRIGSSAFSYCDGLTSVTIPNNVTSIRESAFEECTGLTSVTIPNSVTSIENYTFQGCTGLTSISIPNSVTSIGDSAFSNCTGLTSFTIPNSVTIIRESTFFGCSGLTSITIPNSMTSIRTTAFKGCSGLISVIIPNNVTSIGASAFWDCTGLTSLTIGNSVTSIGTYAFRGCSSLTSVTIPNSVTNISQYAFSGCSGLTSITIPNSVTSIGPGAFSGCSDLTSITVDNGNTKYDSRSNCNAIVETSTNTLIAGCKTTWIPNSVTSIGWYAFSDCTGLTSVTIPNSVTSIGDSAFAGCSNLTSVNSEIETPYAFGDYAFGTISNECVLIVPSEKRDAYIAQGWTESVFKGGIVELNAIPIAMKTSSGADRTMIGYSSQYSLDFTGISDVRAYIAIGFTETKNVILARVYIVPANTGVVLKSDVAGVEVEVPITTDDVYYANLLKPAVNNVTINPSETIDEVGYTNFMVGKLANQQIGFVSFNSPQVRSNNCYLHVPTSMCDNNTPSAYKGEFGVVFVDSETTGINSLKQNTSTTNDAYYDMLGRKVIPNKNGLYIHNGKKIFIK